MVSTPSKAFKVGLKESKQEWIESVAVIPTTPVSKLEKLKIKESGNL